MSSIVIADLPADRVLTEEELDLLFGAGPRKRTPKAFYSPPAEILELRQLMSAAGHAEVRDGVLSIALTEQADQLTIKQDGSLLSFDGIFIEIAGQQTQTLNSDGLKRIDVLGLGGNDRIDLSGVRIAARLDGDVGNDLIQGGLANDVILGGEGVDVLFGGGGEDELHGGSDQDLVSGGSTIDSVATAWKTSNPDSTGETSNELWFGVQNALQGALTGSEDLGIRASERDVVEGGGGADILLGRLARIGVSDVHVYVDEAGNRLRVTTLADGQVFEEAWNSAGGFRRTTWNLDRSTLRETFQNGTRRIKEEWNPTGGFIRTAWELDGKILRQSFQGDKQTREESWDATGGFRRTTWNAAGCIRESFQNGKQRMKEEWSASGSFVRTAWDENGKVLRQTYQGDKQTLEEVWDTTNGFRRTSWRSDGTCLQETFQNGKQRLKEEWNGTGGFVRTAWDQDGKVLRQTYQNDKQTTEEMWDTAGGFRRTTWKSGGACLRETYQDNALRLKEEWTTGGGFIRTGWDADGNTLRQTYKDNKQVMEEAWDAKKGFRRTSWKSDGTTLRETFHDGKMRLKEEWAASGGFVRTGWDEAGNIYRQTYKNGKQTVEEGWNTTGGYRRTEWLSSKTVRSSYQDSKERLREEWIGKQFVRTAWDGQGNSRRETFLNDKFSTEESWDAKGNSMKKTFSTSTGRQTQEERWDTSGGYQVTKWKSDGAADIRQTYRNDKEILREDWNGNKFVRTAWDGKGNSTRQSYVNNKLSTEEGWDAKGNSIKKTFSTSTGRQTQEEKWDNAGAYQLTKWDSSGKCYIRQTFKNGSEVLREEWSGNTFVRNAWKGKAWSCQTYVNGKLSTDEGSDGKGNSIKKWFSTNTGKQYQEDRSDDAGIRQVVKWDSKGTCYSRQTYQNGNERLREEWTGNQYVRNAWDGTGSNSQKDTYVNGKHTCEQIWDAKGASRKTSWYSDGSVWRQYFQNGSEVYRQTWDAAGKYNEYTWSAGSKWSNASVTYTKTLSSGSNGLQGVLNTVSGGGAADVIVNTIKNPDTLIGNITSAFSGLGNIGSSFDGLIKGIDIGKLDSIKSIGVNWTGLDKLFTGSFGKIDFGSWGGMTTFQSIDIGKWAGGKFESLGNWGTDRWKSLEGEFKHLGDWGTARFEAGKGGWNDFKEFANGGWKDFDIKKWGSERWDAFVGGLGDLGEWASARGDAFGDAWHDSNPFREGGPYGPRHPRAIPDDTPLLLQALGYTPEQAEIIYKLVFRNGGLSEQSLQAFDRHFAKALGDQISKINVNSVTVAEADALINKALDSAVSRWLNEFGFNADGTRAGTRGTALQQGEVDDGEDYDHSQNDQGTVHTWSTEPITPGDGNSGTPGSGTSSTGSQSNSTGGQSGSNNSTSASGQGTGSQTGNTQSGTGQSQAGPGSGTGNTSDSTNSSGSTSSGTGSATGTSTRTPGDVQRDIQESFKSKLGDAFDNRQKLYRDTLGEVIDTTKKMADGIKAAAAGVKGAALEKLKDFAVSTGGKLIPGLNIAVTATEVFVDMVDAHGKDIQDRVNRNGDPNAVPVEAPDGVPSTEAALLATKGYTAFKSPEGQWFYVKGDPAYTPKSGWVERWVPNPGNPSNPRFESNPNGKAVGDVKHDNLKNVLTDHALGQLKDKALEKAGDLIDNIEVAEKATEFFTDLIDAHKNDVVDRVNKNGDRDAVQFNGGTSEAASLAKDGFTAFKSPEGVWFKVKGDREPQSGWIEKWSPNSTNPSNPRFETNPGGKAVGAVDPNNKIEVIAEFGTSEALERIKKKLGSSSQ